MAKTGIILQARLTSKRFPCKVLFPLYNGKTVLEIMYEELEKTGLPVIVAVPKTKPNIVLQHWCREHNMNVFMGSEDDCTDRFMECAEFYKIDNIVRVCADTPLIRSDDIMFSLNRFLDTERFTEGNGCQIFSKEMLADAWHNDPYAERREGVSCYHMGSRLDYPEDVVRIQNNMGVNFMEQMRNKKGVSYNTPEIIKESYDMQSGVATEKENKIEWRETYDKIANEISRHITGKEYRILEAGVGEGVIIKRLARSYPHVNFSGFDISKKRMDYIKENHITTFESELGKINSSDNIYDMTYTVHAIEPNGGREEEIIRELLRVTKDKLILIEPTYELGNKETKENIIKHKYCKGIPEILDTLQVKYDSNFLGIGKKTNQNAIYIINAS
jgi:spore coat polysaccharide biosynthesis protein SpsF (cytidylyltransferase family)/ubiquinone/menaquinone biosynthesis C-methylase UbiE